MRLNRLVFSVLLLVSCATRTAWGHIPSDSPYASPAIDPSRASTASNELCAVLQFLGCLYLGFALRATSDPKAPVRLSWPAAFFAALAVQVVIAPVLVVCDFFLFLPLNLGSRCFHINPPSCEALMFFRPPLVNRTLIANAVGFGIALLLSRAMLGYFSMTEDKWSIATVHVLVFHPFLFPVGLLIGFMGLIYLARTSAKPLLGDPRGLE